VSLSILMPPAALEAEAFCWGGFDCCFAKKQGLCRDTTSKMKIRPENRRVMLSAGIVPQVRIGEFKSWLVAKPDECPEAILSTPRAKVSDADIRSLLDAGNSMAPVGAILSVSAATLRRRNQRVK
jgi:hypothetical protein